jgi:hypothetical protein
MIYYRQGLFFAFLFISGVSALAVAIIAKKLNQNSFEKSLISGALYETIIPISSCPKNQPDIDIDESD